MKNQSGVPSVNTSKVITIYALFIFAVLIMVSGAAFSIYSIINDVHFTVLTSSVPGVLFGLVVLYLGLRYCLSVRKLKAEVYKTTSRFSWNNFKKQKR